MLRKALLAASAAMTLMSAPQQGQAHGIGEPAQAGKSTDERADRIEKRLRERWEKMPPEEWIRRGHMPREGNEIDRELFCAKQLKEGAEAWHAQRELDFEQAWSLLNAFKCAKELEELRKERNRPQPDGGRGVAELEGNSKTAEFIPGEHGPEPDWLELGKPLNLSQLLEETEESLARIDDPAELMNRLALRLHNTRDEAALFVLGQMLEHIQDVLEREEVLAVEEEHHLAEARGRGE